VSRGRFGLVRLCRDSGTEPAAGDVGGGIFVVVVVVVKSVFRNNDNTSSILGKSTAAA
jgi:hypothetical protein